MRSLLVAVAMGLASCATPADNSLATLEAELAAKQEASTREFSASRDEVLSAIRSVLDTMSDDYEYSANEHGISASRRIWYYAGLSIISGRDYWQFRLAEVAPNRTTLVVSARHVNNSAMITSPVTPVFLPDIPIEARDGLSSAEAALFLDRVAYALGTTDEWPNCRQRINGWRERNRAQLACSGVGLNEVSPAPRIR